MTKTIKTILLFVIANCFLKIAYTQPTWTWLNPLPQGNILYDVKFIDFNTGYAVGDAGTIFKTTNGGLNWSFCTLNKYGTQIKIAIANPNTIFITSDNSIWRSIDAGLSWSVTNVNYHPNPIFFVDVNTGFAGCVGGVLLKTTNGGMNWSTYYTSSDANSNIKALFFLNANTGFLCDRYIIKKTINGGVNWTIQFKDSNSVRFTSMVFTNYSTGFAVGSGGKIRKTTDGGNTWFEQVSPTDADLNSISHLDSNNLICCGTYGTTYGTIIKTVNGGTTWWQVYTDSVYALNAICYTSNNSIYACGSKGGLVKSTDSGNNWIKISSGIYNDMSGCFFLNSQTGYVACKNDTILKTTNMGVNWSITRTGLGVSMLRVFFTDLNTGYVGCRFGRIIKTTDAGNNWFNLNPGITYSIYSVSFVNSLTGYIGGNNLFEIKHTSDGGNNWDSQIIPVQGIITKIWFVNVNTGFVGTGIGNIVKTTNGGLNWNLSFAGGDLIDDLVFTDENTGYATNSLGVIKTTNNGNSWFVVSNIRRWSLSFADANTGFAAGSIQAGSTEYASISKTTDGGISWTPEYPGFHGGGILGGMYGIFAVNSDICFATGWNSTILVRGSTLVSITPKSKALPTRISLYQNYPNPFNPATVIRYSLPVNSFVNLKIYDILGRELVTLINEQLKPGTYEVEWNADKFSSGMYFYRITAGEFTQTNKMVLMK